MITVIPMMAGCPITHMGHVMDLKPRFEGRTVVGLSKKNGVFTEKERKYIFNAQFEFINCELIFVDSPGETFRYVYDLFHPFREKEIKILLGDDREDYANRLLDSLAKHKFPELSGGRFQHVEVDLVERNTQFSGQKLRQAVHDRDLKVFNDHIGYNFLLNAIEIFHRILEHLELGTISINRR